MSSFLTLLSRTGAPVCNRHGNHIVLTLTIRLTGVDGPWLRLGIVVLIKTGPAAELLSWQQHSSIFPEIWFIQYFAILVEHLITSSLS